MTVPTFRRWCECLHGHRRTGYDTRIWVKRTSTSPTACSASWQAETPTREMAPAALSASGFARHAGQRLVKPGLMPTHIRSSNGRIWQSSGSKNPPDRPPLRWRAKQHLPPRSVSAATTTTVWSVIKETMASVAKAARFSTDSYRHPTLKEVNQKPCSLQGTRLCLFLIT